MKKTKVQICFFPPCQVQLNSKDTCDKPSFRIVLFSEEKKQKQFYICRKHLKDLKEHKLCEMNFNLK